MERFAWMGRIKPDMQAEYKRRHDVIWSDVDNVPTPKCSACS